MGVYTGIALDNVRINSGNASLQSLTVTGYAPVTKTVSFTLGANENYVICTGAGSIAITFPAASSAPGRVVTVKTVAAQTVVSASSNVVALTGGAAGTAILAATAGKWATLVSDGTSWVIMAAA
jgi:hypothetical protein